MRPIAEYEPMDRQRFEQEIVPRGEPAPKVSSLVVQNGSRLRRNGGWALVPYLIASIVLGPANVSAATERTNAILIYR